MIGLFENAYYYYFFYFYSVKFIFLKCYSMLQNVQFLKYVLHEYVSKYIGHPKLWVYLEINIMYLYFGENWYL